MITEAVVVPWDEQMNDIQVSHWWRKFDLFFVGFFSCHRCCSSTTPTHFFPALNTISVLLSKLACGEDGSFICDYHITQFWHHLQQ
jgi:hypothetical protein